MLTGGIDISVGALIAMDCMFLAVGMEEWGISAPVLCILCVADRHCIPDWYRGFCVGYLEIQPFIVTMAGMFFARGMTAVISTNQVSISNNAFFVGLANAKIKLPFGGYVNGKGVLQVPFMRITVVVALVVLVAVFLMLRYTKFGRSLYAVGGNEQSATMMGLDVKKTKLKAYVLGSFLCSIGGICYCLNTMSGSVRQALGLEMDAISLGGYWRNTADRWCWKCHWHILRSADQWNHLHIGQDQRKTLKFLVQYCSGSTSVLLHRTAEYFCKDQRQQEIIWN